MRLFLDTTAFVAMEDQDDENHRKAIDFRQKIGRSVTLFRKLYTSNYIIDETLTLLPHTLRSLGRSRIPQDSEGIQTCYSVLDNRAPRKRRVEDL